MVYSLVKAYSRYGKTVAPICAEPSINGAVASDLRCLRTFLLLSVSNKLLLGLGFALYENGIRNR